MKKESRCSRWVVYITALLIMLAVLPVMKTQTVRAAANILTVRITPQITGSATNAIAIKWNQTSLATGYVIYRKEATQKAYSRVAVVNARTSYYIDKKLKSSTEYHYAVRAYQKINRRNYYSKFTPIAVATRPGRTLVKATATAYNKVNVIWGKVSGVDKYRVFRRASGGSWTVLKDVNAGTHSYTDTTAKANTTYYYSVRPYIVAGNRIYFASTYVLSQVKTPKAPVTVTSTYSKLSSSQIEVMRKILYAVETGGQVYGRQDYSDFTEAYTNSSIEHAITIGAGQWYATEAQRLLLYIRYRDPAAFKKLDTAGIGTDLDTKDWSVYGGTANPIKAGSAKAKCIQNIISSSIGVQCQNYFMYLQIKEYEEEVKSYCSKNSITLADARAMCMMINIRHQGGFCAVTRVLGKTAKPVTLDNIYKALQSDTGNQVGAYKSRQIMVYNALKKYM